MKTLDLSGDVLTRAEAAAYMKRCQPKFDELYLVGVLKFFRVGKRPYFRKSDILELWDKQEGRGQ